MSVLVAEPDYAVVGFGVETRHEGYLSIAFRDIGLVDADGIYPDWAQGIASSQERPESVVEILSDGYGGIVEDHGLTGGSPLGSHILGVRAVPAVMDSHRDRRLQELP
jgi:hypothetical protein